MQESSNIFSSISSRLQLAYLLEKISQSKDFLIDITLYSAFGFAFGYLLKRFSAYVVAIILTITGLMLLQHFGIISIAISWTKLRCVLGIAPSAIVRENVLIFLWEWTKMHMMLAVSFLVGFLLGLNCA